MDSSKPSIQTDLKSPVEWINVKVTKMLSPSYMKARKLIDKQNKFSGIKEMLERKNTIVDQEKLISNMHVGLCLFQVPLYVYIIIMLGATLEDTNVFV